MKTRGPGPHAPFPARQPRSAVTQRRILAATEALLAEAGIEAITMERIAERANVSVGAIYKRFKGKSSLLPLVLQRVQADRQQRLQAYLSDSRWAAAPLACRIDALLEAFAQAQLEQRQLIHSLLIGHWQSADRRAGDAQAANVMQMMHTWLMECSSQIRHPAPQRALSIGLYAALQALQSAILMDRIPPALGIDAFTSEMAKMFCSYLGVDAPAARSRCDGRPIAPD